MKGIMFTELLEMAEIEFGPEFVNNVINNLDSESNGIYTAVGNYDHKELVNLLKVMSTEAKLSSNVLMYNYGRYLFKKFIKYYPAFFENISHPFDFLESIDVYIHKEVLKLYPNAELPKFECNRISSSSMEMIYTSVRRMEDLAHGLIEECLIHFNSTGAIEMIEVSAEQVKFTVDING